MNSPSTGAALATFVLAVGSVISPEPIYRSHPPMRPLPAATKSPLAAGPKRLVDAPRGDDTGAAEAPWKTLAHALRRLRPGDTRFPAAEILRAKSIARG